MSEITPSGPQPPAPEPPAPAAPAPEEPTPTPPIQPPAPAPPSPQPQEGTGMGVDTRTDAPAPQPAAVLEPAPPPEPDENAQRHAEHAIAPGSSGLAVRELAQLLETLGVETYITRGENPDNVFGDELMAAVRQLLVEHHRDNATIEELEGKLREVATLNEVGADTWLLLREKAEQAKA